MKLRLETGDKDKILEYAQNQARRDPRLTDMEFGNFSLICTYGKVEAQAPHIDLTLPNYQFGLILSGNSPGTLFCDTPNTFHRVEAVVDHWQDMPPALMDAMRKDKDAKDLLQKFGSLLERGSTVPQQREKLATGSLLSLPGGVIHAGPASDGFRAVLFFSGWPKGSEAAPYDPDFCRTVHTHARTLPFQIASRSGQEDGKLAHNQQDMEHYIQQVSKWEYMGPRDPLSEPLTFPENEYATRSVPGLYTTFEGRDLRVIVLQRKADGKILLRYPSPVKGGGDDCEGNNPSDKYVLEMNDDELFDGTNGRVLDNKRDEVKCFMRQKDVSGGHT
ncbi:expressed unknown protein [Seminavis robusta]|uniref:Uncharacterized protein n=1 Tax=Seminavis robusta TaxID=568900 RepID=A0A9N8EGL2_9STRA|nr:expressed unknown protein [Seminavis robusta]|eukprot:Sro1131_g244670.1 n/a (332) ;mRNA; f:23104-24206